MRTKVGSQGLTMSPPPLQHLEGDYGLFTWPCAPVLAQYVYLQRDSLIGKNVLEVCKHACMHNEVKAKHAVRCGVYRKLVYHPYGRVYSICYYMQ